MSELIPYEDLELKLVGENGLVLETPWTKIEAEFLPDQRSIFTAACEQIGWEGRKVYPELAEVLKSFANNFIAYSVPRNLAFNQAHCTKAGGRVSGLTNSSPQEWVDAYLPTVSFALDYKSESWDWDLGELLTQSRIAGTDAYDPAAAYRVVMAWVLRAFSSTKKGSKKLVDHLRILATSDEAKFFDLARKFVRQYHHITSTSTDCLSPALYNMPYARAEVAELVHEESGHGNFTAGTLRELGVENPLDIELDPHTVALMDLLRISAHTNALCFSTLFTIFEISGEQDDDPLATLLEKSSRPAAARGIRNHFQLNKDGAHFMSGFPLIEKIEGVDEATIVETLRLSELLVKSFDHLSSAIING